jgi:hypothetical protein
VFPFDAGGNTYMSRGAGRVERLLRIHFDALAMERRCVWDAPTEHFCREVYATEKVTKAQRVAVLRVLHRLASPSPYANLVTLMRGGTPPEDHWHGQWRLWQCHGRRRWSLEARPPAGEGKLDRTLKKLLGMMGSAHEGERANAAALADRMIRENGLTWNDVVSVPRSR